MDGWMDGRTVIFYIYNIICRLEIKKKAGKTRKLPLKRGAGLPVTGELLIKTAINSILSYVMIK